MSNKSKYQRAFSVLHTSRDFQKEIAERGKSKRRYSKAVAAFIVVMLMVSSTVAYAADVGGIQRIVQVWIHGDQTTAALSVADDGSYQMSYKDNDGNVVEQAGQGVAIGKSGKESPLSEDDLVEHINAPDIKYSNDGQVIVYYYGQSIDITDQFTDGICYVKLIHGDDVLYMTVKYRNGYSYSPKKYPDPASFNFVKHN